MGRDILSEYGPDRTMKRPGDLGNMDIPTGAEGLSDQRDVMNYAPPTRVKTPYDPKSVGLHGDNCGNQGSQGYGYERKQSSGGSGIGGDGIRMAGSQGRR